MNDKLECLKKLQEVLKEKFSLEDEVKSIPAHLREEEAKLESDRKKYEELKENLENLTKEHKSLAIRYEDASSQRIGYEKQVEFINTQREFEALAKQLEEAKILEQSLLKQRDSKEQELKALEKAVAAAEADFNSQLQVVEDEHKKVDGEVFLLYLLGYGIGRFWIEGIRTDQLLIPGTSLAVSQAVAVVTAAAALVLILYRRRKKNRHYR